MIRGDRAEVFVFVFVFVFAGVVRRMGEGKAARYAFLTCAPNTVVVAIHSMAMAVILHGAPFTAWLTGDTAEALALPMAHELMRVIPRCI